ncbi:hypothetical protein O181_007369 [Austropuccinia psidii MF-1]|uniref:C2H2-type domain-containing protein n=1 Tax=Austropuccinia psidii MF-1 TaxID=1389203 RepID=A0A9Q3BKS2_9BASI|nr:hypothetical protein [Austropuccinia psidii MF-1]
MAAFPPNDSIPFGLENIDAYLLYPHNFLEQYSISPLSRAEPFLTSSVEDALATVAKAQLEENCLHYVPIPKGNSTVQRTEDVLRGITYLYSSQLNSPPKSDYGSLSSNKSFGVSDDQLYTKGNNLGLFPGSMIPTTPSYESSASPASSRPCTASYESSCGNALPHYNFEPLATPQQFYGLPTDESFINTSQLDQNLIPTEGPPSFPTETQLIPFPSLCLTSNVPQQPWDMIGLEGWPETTEVQNLDHESRNSLSTMLGFTRFENRQSYPWDPTLNSLTGSQAGTTFEPQESEKSFVQSHGIISNLQTRDKEGKQESHSDSKDQGSKACFLPGNWETWETQSIGFDEFTKGDSLHKEVISCRRNTGARKASKQRLSSRPPHRPPAFHPFADSPKSYKRSDGKYHCTWVPKDSKSECGKKFQRAEHLKRHWATHTNLKLHRCEICERFFGRTDNLKQHLKTHENSNGRNSKLLKAKMQQKVTEGNLTNNCRRRCKKLRPTP